MNKILTLILLLACTAAGRAQQLSGRLKDPKDAPVPYANIALLHAVDSGIVRGTVSDSAGAFGLPAPQAGDYLLRISAMGYAPVLTPFTLGSGASKDFGTLTLQAEAKALNSVTVTSLRPTIRQKADRLEVTIEGSTMAAGNTAWSVLSKMPGVFVDHEGNILLNGRSGVTVMLDGKLTYLSGTDLRNLLESMSAENIRNIEIITNPSARYDAAGTAGILNINLRKATQQGTSGSLYGNYVYNFYRQHSYWGGAAVNYKSGRWNAAVSADLAHREGGRNATFTRVFYAPAQTTFFDQSATGSYKGENIPAIRLNADYNISPRQSAGAMFRISRNKSKSDFLTDTYLGHQQGTPDQYIDADNYNSYSSTSYTANVHYVNKLDTSGTQLSADLDFVTIRNGAEGHYFNYFTDLVTGGSTSDPLYTNTPSGYDIYAAKVDYAKALKGGQNLEAGLKGSAVTSDNDSRFYFDNGSLVPDTTRTNHFRYAEQIYAAYLNWNGTLGHGWSAQAGLRGEQTVSRGESLTTGAVNNRSYFGLFPSLFLQKDAGKDYSISLNYSRRLTRPNYGNLNPFRAYRDPYTWYEGNPYLRPQYTHSVSLQQTYKKNYNLSITYELMKDVISELPLLDAAKSITVYTTGNVDEAHSLDATFLFPLRIAKWWDMQQTAQVSYSRFSTLSGNSGVVNEQTSYMLRSIQTILLPLGLRLEVVLLYQGPQAWGLYHMEAVQRVDAGLKKSFLKKHLDLTLNANDIFKGNYYRWSTRINGNINDFDQYFRIRTVGLSLRYNFSHGQKVEIRNRNTPEELNRM